MSTNVTAGQHFVTVDRRKFTEGGKQGVHLRETEWEVVKAGDEFVISNFIGIVREENRPSFAGYPVSLDMLRDSFERRVRSGEIRLVDVGCYACDAGLRSHQHTCGRA